MVMFDLSNLFVRVSYSWQTLTDLQLNHLMRLNDLLLKEESLSCPIAKEKTTFR